MSIHQLQRFLTWLGFIPFLFFSCVYMFTNGVWWITPADALVCYAIYLAVILSFMAGTHWGLVLGKDVTGAWKTLLWSNLIAVIAWIGVAIPFKVIGLSLVFAGFLLQLWLDYGFRRDGVISNEYFRLRLVMTGCVLLTLLLLILRLSEVI